MLEQTMMDRLFGGIAVPGMRASGANGARIAVLNEELPVVGTEAAFFGGFAEDMLAGIGMDFVEELPQRDALKARKA